MAVAWTKTKVGSASAEVIVRDPVVALATLPRFLALERSSQLSSRSTMSRVKSGLYQLTLSPRTGLSRLPRAVAAPHDPSQTRASALADVSDQRARASDAADVALKTDWSRAQDCAQTLALECRARHARTSIAASCGNAGARRSLIPRPERSCRRISLPGTGGVSRSRFARLTGINAAGSLQALDRYPYGCSEQTRQPRAAATLCQQARRPGVACVRYRHGRTAFNRAIERFAGAAGFERRFRSLVGRQMRTMCGCMPSSPIF